ncbi:MAG: amidase, partial [Nitrospinae bacterium CG11_big_fil_rev_8_21_14_0_20_56_8]
MSLKASQGDLADLPAVELIKCFQDQSATPVDATQAALDRIDRFDAQVNAFVDVDRDGALKAAEESTKRWQTKQPMGPLDGVPTTIKDIVWIKGYRTGFGSDVLNMKEAATEDAPCVARLREAGAVFLGTTHTPENGWKALTDSPSCGITRNPWNTDKTPGGSSGGAAAAAALGMGALHVGTDGGGSIRIPSAFTGITGIKPSFGRVPAYPASAFGTVAHVGPMARTVDDLALMLMVLAGADSRDWFSMPANRDFDPTLGLGKGVRGLRIAYSPALGYVDVDPEIAAAVHKAALSFEQLGAHVEEVDPGFDCPLDTFHKHWFSGAMNRTRDLTPDEISKLDPGLIE